MKNDTELVLYGVFRALIAQNVPLGVADYLDAIRALQMQVRDGESGDLPNRDSLRRLCQILWARNTEEARLIDKIFGAIPRSRPEELDDQPTPSPEPRGEGGQAAASQPGRDALAEPGSDPIRPADRAEQLAVEIDVASGTDGTSLPYPIAALPTDETFVLRPQSGVPARTLAVLWRRYRRMRRMGRATEFDLDATIALRTRRGIVDRPVWRAPRVNSARLLILADVSPSMAVWGPLVDALRESLALSRMSGAKLLYFSNVPRKSVFTSPSLSGAVPTDKVFKRDDATSVLIISDAGAARGHFNRVRVERTQAFVQTIAGSGRPIVWINPMPRERWPETTAAALTGIKQVAFLPLQVSSLIRAIDVLRGAKRH